MKFRACIFLFGTAILLFSSGCASVSPASFPNTVNLDKPCYSEVSVKGLILKDQRVAQKMQSSGYGSAFAGYSGSYSSGYGSGFSSGKNQAIIWETFDNPILQDTLRREIENMHYATKVVTDSPTVVEGNVIAIKPSTGFKKISWNVFNTISALLLFGSPYVGSMDADIELRLYENGQLIKTSQGHGRADWLQHGFAWFVEIKGQAGQLAGQIAIKDAMAKLAKE